MGENKYLQDRSLARYAVQLSLGRLDVDRWARQTPIMSSFPLTATVVAPIIGLISSMSTRRSSFSYADNSKSRFSRIKSFKKDPKSYSWIWYLKSYNFINFIRIIFRHTFLQHHKVVFLRLKALYGINTVNDFQTYKQYFMRQ